MHPEEFPNDQNDPGELGRAEAVAVRIAREGYDNAAETIRRLIRRVERRDAFINSVRTKVLAVFEGSKA